MGLNLVASISANGQSEWLNCWNARMVGVCVIVQIRTERGLRFSADLGSGEPEVRRLKEKG